MEIIDFLESKALSIEEFDTPGEKINRNRADNILKPLDIILTRDYTLPISKLISTVTNSVFSHAETYRGKKYSTAGLLMETGLKEHDFDALMLRKHVISGVFRLKQNFPNSKIGIFNKYLQEYLDNDIKYDYSNFVSVIFENKNKEDNDYDVMREAYICSTLLTVLYRRVGLDIADSRHAYSVSPADLEISSKLQLNGVFYLNRFYNINDLEVLKTADNLLKRKYKQKKDPSKESKLLKIEKETKDVMIKNRKNFVELMGV